MEEKQESTVTAESVKIKNFCRDCGLELLQGNELDYITFSSELINRPGLLLTGFEDYFGDGRVQVVGNAEYYYIQSLPEDEKRKAMERFFSKRIPCIIYTRSINPSPYMLELAEIHNIPIFMSHLTTTALNTVVSNYLEKLLAPMRCVHGTLLEISGIGVLLTGRSGQGKSETALELIHRGHRLVADDAVIVKRFGEQLIGTAPEKIKFFMEVRGIGIIDIRSMYGVASVLPQSAIDLVIELRKWSGDEEFDRIADKAEYEEILGMTVPKTVLPVMPGRNLAVVVEVAARNLRMKRMGYDAWGDLMKNLKD